MITFREYEEKRQLDKKLIDQYGRYKVFVVNGKMIRDRSQSEEEFGGSGINAYYDFIPKNEIWIEDDISPKERQVFIHSSLYQLKQIERGKSPKEAYKSGILREKDYRESALLSKRSPEKTNSPVPKSLYIKKYGTIPSENIDVYLVNGEKVRNEFKTDFIEGGHGFVYGWIPNQEIWIEEGPHTESEGSFILLHEYVERTLMKYKKIKYEDAHMIAAKVEFSKRPNHMAYQQVLSLSPEKAISLAKPYLK